MSKLCIDQIHIFAFWARACGAVLLLATLVAGPLDAAEPVSLFDGKTLDGWYKIACQAVAKDNAILLQSGNVGLLQTKERFGDFVLSYEWKALKPDNWDSGVYFRYDRLARVESGQRNARFRQYEVDLRKGMEGDLGGFPSGKNKVPTRPGDWNHFELTVKGTAASLKVNGKAAWQVDGIERRSGYIALQVTTSAGGQFLFRNVLITDLSFTDQGNGTFMDSRTKGLVWLSDPTKIPKPNSLAEAEAWVAKLKSGQHGLTDGSKAGDWRLPRASDWQAKNAGKSQIFDVFSIGFPDDRGYVGTGVTGRENRTQPLTISKHGRDSLSFRPNSGYIWPVRSRGVHQLSSIDGQ